jgi:hypothetical protein
MWNAKLKKTRHPYILNEVLGIQVLTQKAAKFTTLSYANICHSPNILGQS